MVIRWSIVGKDLKTPLKGGGQGDGVGYVGAFRGVKAWLDAHMPHLVEHPFCRIIPVVNGKVVVLDFGSDSVFARLEVQA